MMLGPVSNTSNQSWFDNGKILLLNSRSPNYSASLGFSGADLYGYDYKFHSPELGGWVCWEHRDLPGGVYRLAVSYIAHQNRSAAVEYEVYDRDILVDTPVVDQTSGGEYDRCWAKLGVYYIAFGAIKVKVKSSPKGYVTAASVSLTLLDAKYFFQKDLDSV